jgi:hypothetical protein
MKSFDFGVYQSGYGASVLLMKKTCHSGVKKWDVQLWGFGSFLRQFLNLPGLPFITL